MELNNQIHFDFMGCKRDFSGLEKLLNARNLLEHPIGQWIRETGRTPTEIDRSSFRYELYEKRYAKELEHFSILQGVYDSIISGDDLPVFSEDKLQAFFVRFPSVYQYLEGHLEMASANIDLYLNAMTAVMSERSFHELDYVLQSAQHGISVEIPYNDQFRAARYAREEVVVPPQPESTYVPNNRTLVNKTPALLPEVVVDVMSAQCEVDLTRPLAIVFEVNVCDTIIPTSQKRRIRWDEKGTQETFAPVGLYSGYSPVVMDQSIGVKKTKDYVVMVNGVMRYATPHTYVTVICDGKNIMTREKYVLGTTNKVGTWRYEVNSGILLCRVGGQPDSCADITDRVNAAKAYQAQIHLMEGVPLPIGRIVWDCVLAQNYVYLGKLVKRNKILNALKKEGLSNFGEYYDLFIRAFPKTVYYGDRRLLLGECKTWRKYSYTEFLPLIDKREDDN